MRKVISGAVVLLALGGAIAMAQAQRSENGETTIFGSAATADGGQDVFIVEQPDNAVNPLGNPIVVNPQNTNDGQDVSGAVQDKASVKPQEQEEKPADAQELGKDFQNTLMEANGRVYDVQSFPEQDLNVMGNPSNPATIYSPNVNN